MEFNDIIKSLRIKKGLDRDAAAENLGVAKQTLGHYETGRSEPPFRVLKKMSEEYGVSIGDLFGEEPRAIKLEEHKDLLTDILELLDKKGVSIKSKTFDDLDYASQEIIKSVVSKIMSDIK